MKKGNMLFAVTGIMALSSFCTLHANPVYYTFVGTINHSTYNWSEDLAALGINLGDRFTTTFMVDLDRQATILNEEGEFIEHEDNTIGLPDSGNYIFQNNFHVELVASSLFDLVRDQLSEEVAEKPPWHGRGAANSFYRDGSLDYGYAHFYASAPSIGEISMYIYRHVALGSRNKLPRYQHQHLRC